MKIGMGIKPQQEQRTAHLVCMHGNPGDAAASLQAAGITDFLNLATGLAPLLQRAAQLTSETK